MNQKCLLKYVTTSTLNNLPCIVKTTYVIERRVKKKMNLTFMGPCIANLFFPNITNKMHEYVIYLFILISVHISGGSSAHNQELITVRTASGICHTFTATCRYRGRVETEFLLIHDSGR